MCKCPDLDKENKVISLLCDGKSPGADRLHPKVITKGDRRLFETRVDLPYHQRSIGKLGSRCRRERRSTSPHLQEGRRTRLRQLPQDLASFHTNRSVRLHSAPQTINPSGGILTWGTMWVPRKIRNQRHDLLVTKTREKYALLQIWWLKNAFDTERGSAMEHSTETKVHWPLRLARICLTCRDGGISQVKRRTLGTIWGWEQSERDVFLTLHFPRFSFLWSCLKFSLIPLKACGDSVDRG